MSGNHETGPEVRPPADAIEHARHWMNQTREAFTHADGPQDSLAKRELRQALPGVWDGRHWPDMEHDTKRELLHSALTNLSWGAWESADHEPLVDQFMKEEQARDLAGMRHEYAAVRMQQSAVRYDDQGYDPAEHARPGARSDPGKGRSR